MRLGRKNATFLGDHSAQSGRGTLSCPFDSECGAIFTPPVPISHLSKTAPRRPILDFDTSFGNGRPSPSILEHPQPLSRPNERAVGGGGNGFYPRMISRYFGEKLPDVDFNRLQAVQGWQGVIRGLKTLATMCLHAQQFIQGCCHPGHVGWLALEWIRLEAEKEAERRRNKSLQSKTTMSGLPPLTHKPLGQDQGPKGPALAPKQSQAQKWVEAESRALLSTGGGEEAERRRRA